MGYAVGQSLSKPRARVRTICATDSGLWATIRASDGEKGGPNMQFTSGTGQPLPAMAAQSTGVCQTPVADDAVDRTKGQGEFAGRAEVERAGNSDME